MIIGYAIATAVTLIATVVIGPEFLVWTTYGAAVGLGAAVWAKGVG